MQALPHAPVVVLHTLPACDPTVQSRFTVHLAQFPRMPQYGLVDVGHACVALVPLSPLQPTQPFEVVLHTGVIPVHCPGFVAVHATHWFVVVLHAGVSPLQLPSLVQGSHLPAFAPVVTHTPLVHCDVAVHVPSPGLSPQTLPFGSHTPAVQTIDPVVALHVPSMVGVCPRMIGMRLPFASFVAH